MFCPLCQAEYRDRITQCGDCHVDLLSSAAEARFATARLWKENRQHMLDNVLAALDMQGIPSHFEERVNTTPQVRFLWISFTPRKSTFEYEVWVLRSDMEKARSAVASLI